MKRVRFSYLKHLGKSPLHYATAVDQAREPTRDMRLGVIVHFLVLGPQPGKELLKYPGKDRRDAGYKAFAASNPGAEIVTASEWAEAEHIARAVSVDPVAQELLADTRREVPLQWEFQGLPCETGGIDAIGCGRLIDLKTTSSTEPRKWARQCHSMSYPAQLAWYEMAAQANGLATDKGLYIVGVETDAPYAVTCFKLEPDVVEYGRKQIAAWADRLKRCLSDDHWPGYCQTVLPLELPDWMSVGEEDGDE